MIPARARLSKGLPKDATKRGMEPEPDDCDWSGKERMSMPYRKEFRALIIVAVALVAVLLVIGYMPRPWATGDSTPLEIEGGGETPPELRVP